MKLNVAVTMRITPRDIDVDLNEIEEKLEDIVSKYGKLHQTEKKPIAFGLSAVEALILLDDSKGGSDEIEGELKKLDIVSQVDITDLSLL